MESKEVINVVDQIVNLFDPAAQKLIDGATKDSICRVLGQDLNERDESEPITLKLYREFLPNANGELIGAEHITVGWKASRIVSSEITEASRGIERLETVIEVITPDLLPNGKIGKVVRHLPQYEVHKVVILTDGLLLGDPGKEPGKRRSDSIYYFGQPYSLVTASTAAQNYTSYEKYNGGVVLRTSFSVPSTTTY